MYGDTWEAPNDQIPVIMDDGSERYAESLIASCTVGQCWTYEKDSDAMWRIYSPDRQGVMIETYIDDFYEIEDLNRAVLACQRRECNDRKRRREMTANAGA